MQNYAHYVPEHAERKKPSGNNRYESVPVVASFAIARKCSWPLFYSYIDWERGLRPLSIMYSFRWMIYTSYISICVNVLIDSVSSSKKVTAILSAWLKFHYARLWLLFFIKRSRWEKFKDSLRAKRVEVRVLSPFSLTLSLFSAMRLASCSHLFLSPLDSFYSRSLATSATWRKLQLWPRARGDISSFSSSISPSLLSRRSSRTCCHFIDPPLELRHVSQPRIPRWTSSACVTPFSSAYINASPNFLNTSLAKPNGSWLNAND